MLGTEIDPGKNETTSSKPRIISTDESGVDVLVVPTNEELRIAKQTRDLVDS
jgi:acetate kinase